ncbi:MAG: LacI family DNA-binding transcriptional regulator, partial [Enterococcus casseliflavus]
DNLYISELLQLSTIDHHLQACGETAVQLAVMEKSGNYRMPYEFIKR